MTISCCEAGFCALRRVASSPLVVARIAEAQERRRRKKFLAADVIRELAKTSHARRHAMCVDRSGGGGVRRVDKPGRTVARLSGAIARVGFGLALANRRKWSKGM